MASRRLTTLTTILGTFAAATVIVALDVVSKALARAHLAPEDLVANQRPVALGAFLLGVGVPLALATLVRTPLTALGAGLLTGGVLGNNLERLHRPVTDFIPLPISDWSFYVNLADLSLMAGVVVLIVSLALPRPTERSPRASRSASMLGPLETAEPGW